MVQFLSHTRNKTCFGEADTQNLLIQGDNVFIMSRLLPRFKAKVKCIYIDPPYNTGRIFKNYSDRRTHKDWLKNISDCLELLRQFISDDGSIWVNIDDNECHHLKVLMDEQFGRRNFIANCIWQRTTCLNMRTNFLSKNHDHILVYAKDKNKFNPNQMPRLEKQNKRYSNPDDHPKGPWSATNLWVRSGNHTRSFERFTHTFKNGIIWRPPIGKFSRYSNEQLHEFDNGNEIWFGSDLKTKPAKKTFLSEVLGRNSCVPSHTLWLREAVGDTHEAKRELRKLLPHSFFDTPKPERLLQQILILATNPGDLVFDCFLGSATTAAVALKMGRRFLGIEIGEQAETICIPRLRKVIAGEQGGVSQIQNWNGGGGFKFFKVKGNIDDQN
jgi:adenine-specific DNA-methyltransferase